jgi:tripartite-type tricarboxylate transporter receptor subunit TctC
MKRFAALLLAVPLSAVALLAAPIAAQAQSWPTRPVKFVVPFGAGGPADIYARFLGQRLQEPLGQSFVVENRPGGGSVVGSDYVAKSAPDGYTFLVMSNTHTVNETLIPKKPFQLMKDFAPVTPINYSDLLLVVHPSVPASNLAELIALAKSQPGKMNYASSGPGTPYHMAGELFKSMAGIDVVHVPYKGSDGARVGILGGQVQMMFDAITTMAPNVRAGKLKGFGTSGRARSSVLPETPTVAEAGVPGYEATIWLGVVAPAGTPAAIVDRLNGEIRKITSSTEVKEAWGKQGATPLVMTTAEFTQYLQTDIAKWAKVIAQAGIKLD